MSCEDITNSLCRCPQDQKLIIKMVMQDNLYENQDMRIYNLTENAIQRFHISLWKVEMTQLNVINNTVSNGRKPLVGLDFVEYQKNSEITFIFSRLTILSQRRRNLSSSTCFKKIEKESSYLIKFEKELVSLTTSRDFKTEVISCTN